jgi:alkylation response protein AidB-like acyl-CoA dehydrogenase
MEHDLPAVLAEVRAVAAGPARAHAASVDKDRAFPRETLNALAKAGALGLLVPADAGGSGGALSDLAEACEELGAACASSAMVFLMHSVTAATIAAGGGDRAGEILARMATGEALGTLAFSERGTGAHFYAPELRAQRSNGSLRVSGRKSFVTSGGEADVYLILVQGEAEGSADAYVLERGRQGISFDGEWEGLGMAGNSSIAMQLDDVVVEDATRIGPAGRATELVFAAVAPFFLVGLSAVNVGIAAAAAQAATEHAKHRTYPDGSSLAEIQTIQHSIADMDIPVRRSRLLVREAARLGEAGDASALVAIMESKVAATEAAAEVTGRALEVTGGQGYTPALPIERNLRDARAGAVMAPTNAVLRNWIGKALAGLPVP